MEDINKDIENLEEIINLINEELDKKDKNVSAILDLKDLSSLRNLIKAYKELKEENEKLKSDNLEYQRTQDIFDERTYRKKYLEERRKEEPNLLYPDADEIYKRYYKLREENKELKKNNKRYEKELHDVIEFSIPVSLVEEKIEELNKQYDFYNSDRRETKSIAKGYYIAIQKLQELLEKR